MAPHSSPPEQLPPRCTTVRPICLPGTFPSLRGGGPGRAGSRPSVVAEMARLFWGQAGVGSWMRPRCVPRGGLLPSWRHLESTLRFYLGAGTH